MVGEFFAVSVFLIAALLVVIVIGVILLRVIMALACILILCIKGGIREKKIPVLNRMVFMFTSSIFLLIILFFVGGMLCAFVSGFR